VSNRRLILVVEDDASLRLLWRAALRIDGFDVMEAGDGIEALRIIEQHTPDLVVLDLGLPGLDGASVRQEIAAHLVTRNIPIVIVTASTEELAYLDVECILRKPATPEQVVMTVRRCLPSGAPDLGS
jgi:CheY-like chemotaxis protein